MTMPVSLKDYFAAAGSAFTKRDAEVIGPQLEALAEAGPIDERTIVEVARSPNSPLNRYFEWDDETAADKYRVGQAGSMMRSIRVRVVEDGRPRVTSAYKLVTKPTASRPAPKGYNVLHGESAFAAKMTVAAYDDMLAWRAKYAPYVDVWVDFATAFRQVANQVGELEEAGKPAEIDVQTDAAVQALLAWRESSEPVLTKWEAAVEQVQFLLDAIDEADAVFTTSLKAKERSCLRCSTPFQSSGIGNRLCEKCSGVA
ncbi:hypothetical protein LGH83_04505 [Lichenihabitans sp. PAMC28606]|uniref:hypothetical protein n=1 Tax=Lichenihabitans sp. PAMC28606 TaxID=2880932 RepID=UPI001D0AA0A4|nr:hypothetical protein [Lichenihabitans sp. PAMC28606]UDL95488.1 hypothetical protein LGH83_04505 [Lichenihabitans sp. PAMC28606]